MSTISITGMHCDACEKTITRILRKEGIAVRSIDHKSGKAVLTGSPDRATVDRILRTKGYSLAAPAGANGLLQAYRVERAMIANGILVLGILLVIQAVLARTIYQQLPGFRDLWTVPMLLIPVAVMINLIALRHQRAYQRDVSCMTGMMVGMTIGMTVGLVIGAITGITNGMFWGSIIAMAVAIPAGIYAGRCCGVMGVMEGMMAGVMGGTMGAMLTVMMLAEHPVAFTVVLLGLTAVILGGLIWTIIQEHKGSDVRVAPWPLHTVFIAGLVITLVVSALILLLPHGAFQ